MRLLVSFVLLCLVAACSSGAAEPPEGFARAEGDGFAFAYPQDWELTHDLATVTVPGQRTRASRRAPYPRTVAGPPRPAKLQIPGDTSS